MLFIEIITPNNKDHIFLTLKENKNLLRVENEKKTVQILAK
jgi:hypothetical protein